MRTTFARLSERAAEEKQAIVAESLEPNVSIAGIARKQGIRTGQLDAWRHQFLIGHPGRATGFARVELMSEPLRLTGPIAPSCGLIEIVLPVFRRCRLTPNRRPSLTLAAGQNYQQNQYCKRHVSNRGKPSGAS